MRIVLLGGPGAGKGTQAAFICRRYGIAQISTGDMLRALAEEGHPQGLEARRLMDAGQLVPDALIVSMVRERIRREDCRRGFLLDGFPRTLPQARALRESGERIDHVIVIEVSPQEIVRRISGRRVHPGSGRTYHKEFNPPRECGRDDVTGEPLVQRDDDREETVLKRLSVFQAQTAPLIEFYEDWAREDAAAPRAARVDGSGSMDDVRRTIEHLLEAG